jgi:tripartite-type tricarboxylate transporter receptor subunit TctC
MGFKGLIVRPGSTLKKEDSIMRYGKKYLLVLVSLWVTTAVIYGSMIRSEAAEFPAKAITMLCGSTAGSPVDVMARQLAKPMEKILGKPVVVQNKPGGSQAEELSTMLAQPPNGYMIGTVTTSTVGALAGHLRDQFKFDDFYFLVLVQTDPYALVVKADSPLKDFKGLMEYAKSNPGRIKVGGFGTGSGHHMAFLDLADRAGVEMRWVAFDGGAAAIAAALGGHVDITHTNPGVVKGHVDAGKMRVLAVASEKRLEVLPQVPTYREEGVDLVLIQWRGVAMKAGAPKEIQEKLIKAITQSTQTPEFKQYMKNTNQLEGKLSGQGFQNYVWAEFQQTTERLKKLGVIK